MSDLIKREDAIEAIRNVVAPLIPTLYGTGIKAPLDCEMALEAIPSADRPQGEWIETNNGYDTTCECSACHYRDFIPNYQVGSEFVCMDRYWFERDFCPICGAYMKGADDEDQ